LSVSGQGLGYEMNASAAICIWLAFNIAWLPSAGNHARPGLRHMHITAPAFTAIVIGRLLSGKSWDRKIQWD